MKQRSAFTLVELLTTLTLGSSIMLLAIGLVHQSMSMSKLAKVRWEHDQASARLAQLFRSDAHMAAELISLSPDSVSLKLIDGSVVNYKSQDSNVTWEKTSPNSEKSREKFSFEANCRAAFQRVESPDRIVLQLERQSENTELAPRVDLRIVSIIGRWQQLQELQQTGGKSQ